ncbi:MAG: bifunctional GNAT family N-acetyltransferase/carbon-nitrogen hydrolase family protein [Flavobacteriales bacterium]|nr:bifunctional GNAT family N-acetyltransferase/carbon-nitrogen hydrolase family protein [Flavobacteriales bacterium]MCB9449765.1 bifunctional GNAT family N-acetyltransferase/carbon-nitrogen hydrolase family protein [Flavobacteriales bacterium]
MEIKKIELRNLTVDDYAQLESVIRAYYSTWENSYWKPHHIEKLVTLFPEGQLAAVADGKVVGCALTLIINHEDFEDDHTYREITGNFTFDTHDPDGDILYGIDVFVDPKYRGLRLGRRMYDARKDLCEQLNLRSIVFGGRIPNYAKYATELSPKEYIEKVRLKEIYDPVLTFQLSNDFHVRKVLKGYMPGDENSQEYATLLEWNNIYYTKSERTLNAKKTHVRIGLVQWQMRSFPDLEALYEQMEFFVDAVSGYKADFALFPELFNAPLMAEFNHLPEPEAIRKLAGYTEPIRNKFQEFAISYNVNIITGSMPELVNRKLYNVGFLCRRDGTYEKYQKLHITPNEINYWGMQGGDTLRVMDTDCGKIGILICYDVEFPELPRILAQEGMKILFVPFLTDTQNGYTRVKSCASARAIENECYVAIAGSVGNLPRVNNMDIQYAESGVFTPSDFAFPADGVRALATPNTEMTLIADVDLDLLKHLQQYGSVTNMKDRRTDLYELKRVEKSQEKK